MIKISLNVNKLWKNKKYITNGLNLLINILIYIKIINNNGYKIFNN